MNTDYLKYDASSIVEYLRRCIIEKEIYTDQLYPGSDTSLLINMFAWTFECMQYILNSNASDVLFQDSSVYENMNRMVKLLSYSPKAYTTSTAEFTIDGKFKDNETADITIPKYTRVNSGLTDTEGNTISYSFTKDYTFSVRNGNIIRSNRKPILYNGEFYKYTFDVQTTGNKYETFVMTGIGPNEDTKTYIDNDSMNVYIEYVDDNGATIYDTVKVVSNLIMDASMDDLACEIRLNENKEVTIKFGDGIHGKIPPSGTKVHLIYLKSNGPNGKVSASAISSNDLRLHINGFTDNFTFINLLFGGQDKFRSAYEYLFTHESLCIFETNKITLSNTEASSDVIGYEDVNEIREYAPDSFKMGNRLVTAADFRTFILNNFKNRVRDAYVCNNNTYCMTFYKWLADYDKLNINIRLNSYEYADANDFNNIYVWLIPNANKLLDSDKRIIVKECENRKSLTTNIIPCEGVKVYFVPYMKNFESNKIQVDSSILSKSYLPPVNILVEKERTHISDERIKLNIVNIIINYFKEHSKFGDTINFSEIYQRIMALGYINSVKTVLSDNSKNVISSINGLSFAAFTPELITFKDFEVYTQFKVLNRFQYAELLLTEQKLKSLIRITNENSFTLKNDEI